MANYQVLGRDAAGSTMVTVAVSSVDQDGHYLDDMDVVNAVKSVVAGAAGVSSVVARKFEQVITLV